jgi:hypothetical protein
LQPLVILTPELKELVEAAKEWAKVESALGVHDAVIRLNKAVKAFEESVKEKV